MNKSKKRFFYFITLLIPIVFFILLELVLRLLGYGAQQPVFITDVADENYLIFNPQVSERYFAQKEFSTQGQYDVFLKEKNPNTLRIFIQGASTSAGFPYNHSGSFPRLLEQKLQHYYSDKNIEVVNTSLAATNSFTLLDLTDEIIAEKPDMVIIYGGHNEYYGALGVGSSQSFGKSTEATNLYLRLKNVRIVQLIKNIVKGIYSVRIDADDEQTLMAKMVKDESIPFNSPLYEQGVTQYRSNIESILRKYKEADVPVFICTLVSNIKDFKPFQSSDDSEFNALGSFQEGVSMLETNSNEAKEKLENARNYDLLKFRAPSAIEQSIKELANELNVPVIDTRAAFEKNSEYGLIGDELLLEHVHANLDGQRLFSETIFDSVSEFLSTQGVKQNPVDEDFQYITSSIDSLYGVTLLQQLLSNWPFTNSASPVKKPTNEIERLISGETSWVAVMNSNYIQNIESNPSEALSTAKVLLQEYPHQTQPYIMVAEALAKLGQFRKADETLLTMPKKLINLEVYKVRLTNLIDTEDYQTALPLARTVLQLENTMPNQYTLQALTDILAVDWENLSSSLIVNYPDKHVKALGALFYLKKKEKVEEYYKQLFLAIPNNKQLQQLANVIELN